MEGLFHVHSNYSADGRLSLETLREECLKRNLKFMVVTDHAEDFPPGRVKTFVEHCRKISNEEFFVVPGLEFNIDPECEVHLLVVGLGGLPYEEGPEAILKKAREAKNSALAVVAHPSRGDHYIPPDYENRIDGIEIWNAAYDSRYLPDHKAIRLFANLKKKNPGLVAFGGLDLHDHSGFRAVALRLTQSCRNEEELLNHLRMGRFTIQGPYLGLSALPRLKSPSLFLLSLGRRILGGADSCRWRLFSLKKALLIQKPESRKQKEVVER